MFRVPVKQFTERQSEVPEYESLVKSKYSVVGDLDPEDNDVQEWMDQGLVKLENIDNPNILVNNQKVLLPFLLHGVQNIPEKREGKQNPEV